MSIVSIRDVTFTYPGTEIPVLKDLNFELETGTFLALMGGNGSGKSSLCKLLTGIIPQFFQGEFHGSVEIKGLHTRRTRISELAKLVGYVYQDFENQLVKPRVIQDVAFAPLNFGYSDYQVRAGQALETLGLSYLADRIIWELSGGEQHLVALAGALALDPEIIVVDEPISQLDPKNAETVYQKLALLNDVHGKTIIVIEHHPEFIANYCDSVALMSEGKLLWQLPVEAAFNRVEELIAHDIYPPQVTRVASGVDSLKADSTYPIRLDEGVSYFLDKIDIMANGLPDSAAMPPRTEAIVNFAAVSHRYQLLDDSYKTVLDQVDLTCYAGERIALVGGNGAGKSTLLKMITGLTRPSEGEISIFGRPSKSQSPEKWADEIALIYQDPQLMFIEESVRRDISFFLEARQSSETEVLVGEALRDFKLEALAERDGRLLSGGQMRRASLAIGACMRPRIMLLDEPTSSLDVANRRQIIRMLRQLDVDLVIIASHDMELVAEWANRVIVLQNGRIMADASPATLFNDLDLVDRAGLWPPQVVRLSHALGLRPAQLSVDRMIETLGQMTNSG